MRKFHTTKSIFEEQLIVASEEQHDDDDTEFYAVTFDELIELYDCAAKYSLSLDGGLTLAEFMKAKELEAK